MSRLLRWLVTAVTACAAAAVAVVAWTDAPSEAGTLLLLMVLAGIAGAHSIRLSPLHCEFTATHPAILCALAWLGPTAAVLTAASGVLGTALANRRRLHAVRLVYNLAAVALSTSAAAWSFLALGGIPGGSLRALLLPLFGATTVYFLANTGLVTAAVALEKRRGFFSAWAASFSWSVPSYFTGLTLSALLLLVLESLGPWGLALGIPPIWLVASFYRAHRDRVEEQRRRVREVETLNATLEAKVGELREAMAHVKRLQGLLPICMHCKRIRDDRDAWHQIETYIAEHTEARFTHALCSQCRERHYPSPSVTRT